MGKIILQIISLLVSPLLQWWERKQQEKLQKEREARRDAVNADPAGEFVRTFKPGGNSTTPSHTANSDQSGPDTGGRNNVG